MKFFGQIAAFWSRFSAAERHQIVGAACFLIAFFYGALLWRPTHEKLSDLVYKEQKQNVRNRKANQTEAELKSLSLNGIDVQAIRKDLAQARESLAALEREQARLLARFLLLDDLESVQALKSDITRLAESGDMEVTALEHIYRRKEDRDLPPTLELLKESGGGNIYGRPLLRLRARASYQGLMEFLDGLQKLPRIAAPVWSDIGVGGDRAVSAPEIGKIVTKAEKVMPSVMPSAFAKQWLELEIHLAI